MNDSEVARLLQLAREWVEASLRRERNASGEREADMAADQAAARGALESALRAALTPPQVPSEPSEAAIQAAARCAYDAARRHWDDRDARSWDTEHDSMRDGWRSEARRELRAAYAIDGALDAAPPTFALRGDTDALRALREAQATFPMMRLGQLIENARKENPDLFYLTDADLALALREYVVAVTKLLPGMRDAAPPKEG